MAKAAVLSSSLEATATRVPSTALRSLSLWGTAVDQLSLTPSEYFARNCYLGASLFIRQEAEMRHEIGIGRIMWGQDYPHSEGTFPYSREALREAFWGVPEDEVRLMVGETAASVYGFDLGFLQPIADRVGPTVEEVSIPLAEDRPRIPEDTVAYNFSHDNVAAIP
jgi:hypothetical protein